MALTCKAFGDIITFTRASSATFVGSNGLIQSAAIDAPRFDYDPVTLAAKGLLIEEQRTNLLTYSEQFDNAAWVKINTTIVANSTNAPDGAVAADTATTTSTADGVSRDLTALTANATYTLSFYIKNASATWLRLVMYESAASTNRFSGWFNATTGVAGSATNGGTGTGAAISVVNVGNGWYRVALSGAVNNSATACTVQISTAIADGSTTGVNAVSYYLWGAQLEAGSFATSYIPTVASQVTRSQDVASVNTLSPWYNATEGTLYGEWLNGTNNSGATLFALDDSTNSNRIVLFADGTTGGSIVPIAVISSGGVNQANFTFSAISENTTHKLALGYKANDFAATIDGGAAVIDTSGTVPVVNKASIGVTGAAAFPINGHIRRITYYPRRLSNAELQAITA